MKQTLIKPELVSKLQNELSEIKAYCSEYDLGNESSITMIANLILTVFHNSNQSKSLLSQLKLNHLPVFCSSETYDAKHLTNFIGLLKLKHLKGKGWRYVAELDEADLKKVSQENWWNSKKVIVDSDGIAYTRSKIIQSVANSATLNLNTSGWKLKDSVGNHLEISPIPEAVRQIAFELLTSFYNVDFNTESKLHYKA